MLRCYSRSPILAKCRRFTQEILLRGFGVMKTTMTLMGRPDLWRESITSLIFSLLLLLPRVGRAHP